MGDEVHRAGWWPSHSATAPLWTTGHILRVGASSSVISTDTKIEITVSAARIVWRPKKERFECFSADVAETVAQIERQETTATVTPPRSSRSLRTGEYVVCFLPALKAYGFITKRLVDGYLVSLGRERRWRIRDSWLTYDSTHKVWIADGRGQCIDA